MSQRITSVLIVEDDRALATTIATVLAEYGYRVCGPAGNIADALGALDGCDADAAILDYKLNGSTSESLVPMLEARSVPICVTTGTPRNELPVSYLKHAFLAKPYGPRELIKEIERLINQENSMESEG